MTRRRRYPSLGHRLVMSILAVAVVLSANAWVHDAGDIADARAALSWPEAQPVANTPAIVAAAPLPDGPGADGRPDHQAPDMQVASDTTIDPSTAPAVALDAPRWELFEAALRASLGGNDAYAAAVLIDGEVVYETVAGERIPGEPALTDHRFRLASLSKVVTATVVLQLVQDGLVGLDEPVGQLIADHLGVGPVSEATAAVTVRRILSHTAGFGQDWSFYFSDGLDKHWRDNAAAALRGGVSGSSGFSYSNTTYVVAGALIEALTWRSYEEVVAERLLVPLGIEGPRLGVTQVVGPGEVLHRSDTTRSYMEALGPAGGWVMSAAEIAVIVDSLRTSSTSWQPLSFSMAASMMAGVDAWPTSDRSYGLGVMRLGDGSFGHTGTLQQARTMAIARPDGVTWSVVVNGSRPDSSQLLYGVMERAVSAALR
jgi:D-alanyl-D-alanine carboxypeptidase